MNNPYTTKLIRRAAEEAKNQLRLRTVSTWASAFQRDKNSAWVLSVMDLLIKDILTAGYGFRREIIFAGPAVFQRVTCVDKEQHTPLTSIRWAETR